MHFADIELLPGFTVDDARKLKGGEGAQFRTDAVKMVELETARVAQLHDIVGTDDVWLACDGVIMDPADWTALDAALAAAQAQVDCRRGRRRFRRQGNRPRLDRPEETARYQAIAGAEQAPPPPEGGALSQQRRDFDPNLDPNLPPGQIYDPRQSQGSALAGAQQPVPILIRWSEGNGAALRLAGAQA